MKDLAERYRKATLDFISLHNIYQPTATKSKRVLCARLKNTRIFFHVLGNPDKDLRIIHVAGTSGKGSVVQLLHRILQANGENVASYISPHTTTYLERFLFNNALIDTELLLECIEEVTCIYAKFLEKNAPLSFMDISTGLGLYTFKKAGARWCVLETGCGGRYDGTNAISGAEIDIITNISKDHTEVLGDTLEDIALAKAGIMKKNGTAIVGERRPRLKKIFCEEAVKKEAALFFITNEVHHRNPTLAGQHQGQNTAIALAAAK